MNLTFSWAMSTSKNESFHWLFVFFLSLASPNCIFSQFDDLFVDFNFNGATKWTNYHNICKINHFCHSRSQESISFFYFFVDRFRKSWKKNSFNNDEIDWMFSPNIWLSWLFCSFNFFCLLPTINLLLNWCYYRLCFVVFFSPPICSQYILVRFDRLELFIWCDKITCRFDFVFSVISLV